MTKQKFNLFQIAATLSAKLRTRAAEIVRTEAFDTDLFGTGLDHTPNGAVVELITF